KEASLNISLKGAVRFPINRARSTMTKRIGLTAGAGGTSAIRTGALPTRDRREATSAAATILEGETSGEEAGGDLEEGTSAVVGTSVAAAAETFSAACAT